jgi:hypothetical protein
MGDGVPEWNYCLLMKGGFQLNFKKMFLESLVNLVNNVPNFPWRTLLH